MCNIYCNAMMVHMGNYMALLNKYMHNYTTMDV